MAEEDFRPLPVQEVTGARDHDEVECSAECFVDALEHSKAVRDVFVSDRNEGRYARLTSIRSVFAASKPSVMRKR